MGRRGIPAPSFRIGTDADEIICYRDAIVTMIYDEALAMACNSIKINNHPNHIPQWFVLQTLFERGEIAYFGYTPETTNAFACGGSDGIDIYGNPLAYLLTPKSGQSFMVGADDPALTIVRANATRFPLANAIRFAAERIADCEVAISANLIHTNSTDFIPVADDKQVATLKTAMRRKQLGMPTVYVRNAEHDALTRGNDAYSLSHANDFFADRIALLRDQYRQELLAKIGTLTANRYKRERVQSAEVNAGVGEVIDSVYMLIDQYNADVKRAGLPFEMVLNSAVADLYTDGEVNADV